MRVQFPINWTGHEGRFFVPGLPNAVALFRHQLRASKLGSGESEALIAAAIVSDKKHLVG